MDELHRKTFEIVKAHLLAQGKRSKIPWKNSLGKEDKICAYRSPEGLKCAVGVLIADEHYSENLEAQSVTADNVFQALSKSGFGEVSGQWLRVLQRIHDNIEPKDWPRALDVFEKLDAEGSPTFYAIESAVNEAAVS